MHIQRNRIIYIFLLLLIVVSGLLSRRISDFLPELVNIYIGDAIWAIMVYLLVCIIFIKWSVFRVAAISLLFCYVIELSQLYQAEWINNIRNTIIGGLVLGYGFLWSDLLAYAMGIGFTGIIEYFAGVFQKR